MHKELRDAAVRDAAEKDADLCQNDNS